MRRACTTISASRWKACSSRGQSPKARRSTLPTSAWPCRSRIIPSRTSILKAPSPVPVNGEYFPGTEKEAAAMLVKGDLKFRLKGKRLNGDFALVHIKARRSGSKGNEWLLIKKKDDHVVAGFNIDAYDTSILTDRTMAQIAGDESSAEWKSSRPASRGKVKTAWLADAIARADSKREALTAES